jgi:hypothetical protein
VFSVFVLQTFNPWRVLQRAACLFHPASQSCASLHLPVPLPPPYPFGRRHRVLLCANVIIDSSASGLYIFSTYTAYCLHHLAVCIFIASASINFSPWKTPQEDWFSAERALNTEVAETWTSELFAVAQNISFEVTFVKRSRYYSWQVLRPGSHQRHILPLLHRTL